MSKEDLIPFKKDKAVTQTVDPKAERIEAQ